MVIFEISRQMSYSELSPKAKSGSSADITRFLTAFRKCDEVDGLFLLFLPEIQAWLDSNNERNAGIEKFQLVWLDAGHPVTRTVVQEAHQPPKQQVDEKVGHISLSAYVERSFNYIFLMKYALYYYMYFLK